MELSMDAYGVDVGVLHLAMIDLFVVPVLSRVC